MWCSPTDRISFFVWNSNVNEIGTKRISTVLNGMQTMRRSAHRAHWTVCEWRLVCFCSCRTKQIDTWQGVSWRRIRNQCICCCEHISASVMHSTRPIQRVLYQTSIIICVLIMGWHLVPNLMSKTTRITERRIIFVWNAAVFVVVVLVYKKSQRFRRVTFFFCLVRLLKQSMFIIFAINSMECQTN